MKYVRKAATGLVLAAMLCMVLATAAFAAGTGSLWVNVVKSEGTSALIVTDATVTDGVVKLTYDSTALTYQEVVVAEEYVAMYAVNAEEAGTVLISWVAPEAYALDGEAVSLMQVNFTGTSNAGITLTGTAHDAQGNTLTLADAPDTAALEAVIAEAEKLDSKDYTGESFADVEEALAAARKVLDDTTATQAEVDAAAAALRSAIDGLKKAETPTPSQETTRSEETSGSTATKATESTGDSASTGDNSNVGLFIILGIVSIVGIGVLVVLMVLSNKKDKKGPKAPAKKKGGRYAK